MKGRPSTYTPEIGKQICDLIADGKTTREVAEELSINKDMIRKWRDQHPDFSVQYAHAREASAESFEEEIMEVSLDKKLDSRDKHVRIEALKWAAGIRKSKVYGKRAELNVTAEVKFSDMSVEQLAEAEAKLLAKYGITKQVADGAAGYSGAPADTGGAGETGGAA